MVQWIIDIVTWPWRRYKENKAFKKRMEEIRKRDPFIYK